MVWARNGRTEILATSPIATIRIVDEESQSGGGVLRTGLTIVWIVVFSNGVLFYLARRVFGRSAASMPAGSEGSTAGSTNVVSTPKRSSTPSKSSVMPA